MRSRLDPDALATAFVRVRTLSEGLVAPLEPEDTCIQSMPDVSPSKWHLAHTSWFFETFVLASPGYQLVRERYDYLFNSYYQTVGAMHTRSQRGLLSRPTLAEVLDYRRAIDARMLAALPQLDATKLALVELGLHHEQQHQELILTDIKHVLAQNPLAPSYRRTPRIGSHASGSVAVEPGWLEHPGGLVELGRNLDEPDATFGFDNEGPRHKQWLEPFALACRPSTCAAYLEFIADDGYARSDLWLAEGWDTIRREGWRAPAYWQPPREPGDPWHAFTLDGLRELDGAAPVCHLSYFEADAFARWAHARLPSEAEWEQIAATQPVSGNLLPIHVDALEHAPLAPQASVGASLFGDVWEWTASPYLPYPGFAPAPGAVGEYNGKFMCNQLVLRGGSCATPADHIRASYRNFFPSSMRWQFCGVRLAR